MRTVATKPELQALTQTWRSANEKIALVPTMGNLHDGHLQLVKTAKDLAERVVVSIFVNPTQFGVNEDFDSYPRTERDDQQKLAALNVDVLFLPAIPEMYAPDSQTVVSATELAIRHCGRSRPGHFDGVATVVCKLFNIVQPTVAVFGQKDFQQLAVIRTLVRDLHMPIRIVGVDTVRAANGLALSSRNGYLSATEQHIAPLLYQSLIAARDAVIAGTLSFPTIERQSWALLQQAGFQPDYFSICRQQDLQTAQPGDRELVILAAAKLGKTRLIDNVCVTLVVAHADQGAEKTL